MEVTEMHGENSLFNLEYRNTEDDAWYTARVELSLGSRNGDDRETKLTVKFEGFNEHSDFNYFVGQFRTLAEVDEFVKRFRPLSEQFQDRECCKVTKGTKVCAALSCQGDDLRYFDAIVDTVNKQKHVFTNGEEECTCTFVLFWLHGPISGNLTAASIANICRIKTSITKVGPDISSFVKMAKQRVSSPYSSLSRKPASCEESGTANGIGHELQIDVFHPTGKACRYLARDDSDKDLGGEEFMDHHVASADGLHIILINNLENNISPSTIVQFIHKHTSILPKVLVFPSQPSVPYASGVICLSSETNLEKIFKFLINPGHMIVSARGRPWIISRKMFWHETLGSAARILEYEYEDECWKSNTNTELKVVQMGSEAYKKAVQLRELFMEFIEHMNRIHNRLAFEEAKILQ